MAKPVNIEIHGDIKDLIRSLKKAKAEMKKLEGKVEEVKNTNKRAFKESGDAAKRYGDKGKKAFKQVGDQAGRTAKITQNLKGILITTFTAAAVIQGMRKMLKTITEFETAMKNLQSLTGLVGKDLEFLKDKAIEFSNESTVAAKDVTEAFMLVGSAMPVLLKMKDALADVTKQAIILSEASGLDMATSVRALTGTLNQFELSAKEAERVINALAAGSKEGAAAIPDLADSIDRFGAVANKANITVERSIGLIEVLAEKNLKGAESGTQLRNIILKLQAAGIGFVDGMFDINVALTEVAEKNLDAKEMTKLFGLESILAAQILTDNIPKIDKYTKAVTGTNTALEQAEINTNTISAAWDEMGNKWSNLVLKTEDGGGAISKVIRAIIVDLGNFANNLGWVGDRITDFFEGLGFDIREEKKGFEEYDKIFTKSINNILKIGENAAHREELMWKSRLAVQKEHGELTAQYYGRLFESLEKDYLNKKEEAQEDADLEELKATVDHQKKMTDAEKKAYDKRLKEFQDFKKKYLQEVEEDDLFIAPIDKATADKEWKKFISDTFESIGSNVKDKSDEWQPTLSDHIFRALGIAPDQQELFKENINQAYQFISDFYTQILDRQIQYYDEKIRLQENNISETQRQIGIEQEDRRQGFANEVTAEKEKLAKLKTERDKALKERQKVAKAQQRLETVQQTISLVSASANIIQSFSKLGPIGTILSVIALAAMWATFASAKAKAASVTKLAKGEVDIKGGQKGKDTIPAMLMEGESVLTVDATRKRKPLLMAMNEGNEKLVNSLMIREVLGTMDHRVNLDDSKNLAETNQLLREFMRSGSYTDANGNLIVKRGIITRKILN